MRYSPGGMRPCYDEHVDLTKLGFPSISIVDDGAPADQADERMTVPLKQGGNGTAARRRRATTPRCSSSAQARRA